MNYFKLKYDIHLNALSLLTALENCGYETYTDLHTLLGQHNGASLPECIKSIIREARIAHLKDVNGWELSEEELTEIYGDGVIYSSTFEALKKGGLVDYLKEIVGFSEEVEGWLNSVIFSWSISIYEHLEENGFNSDEVDHVNQVLDFITTHNEEVQFSKEEINRFLENPELFQEISTFLSQHLVAGGSESDKNLAVAIARAYDDIYAEFGSTTLDLGDGPSDPIRDIVIDMLLETVKELVADFVPGGTLATIGPELFNNLQGGQWMDAMYNAVDIVLNEADTLFPAAKMGSFALGAYVKGKHLKKAFKAFNEAKSLGQDFLFGLYRTFREKLNLGVSTIRDNFQWIGKKNGVDQGAKFDGISASECLDKLKQEFNVTGHVFINPQQNTYVYKIAPLPGPGNKSIFMEMYPDSNSGYAYTIGFYTGPNNAVSAAQLNQSFKIRFDF